MLDVVPIDLASRGCEARIERGRGRRALVRRFVGTTIPLVVVVHRFDSELGAVIDS